MDEPQELPSAAPQLEGPRRKRWLGGRKEAKRESARAAAAAKEPESSPPAWFVSDDQEPEPKPGSGDAGGIQATPSAEDVSDTKQEDASKSREKEAQRRQLRSELSALMAEVTTQLPERRHAPASEEPTPEEPVVTARIVEWSKMEKQRPREVPSPMAVQTPAAEEPAAQAPAEPASPPPDLHASDGHDAPAPAFEVGPARPQPTPLDRAPVPAATVPRLPGTPTGSEIRCPRCGEPSPRGLCEVCSDALAELRELMIGTMDSVAPWVTLEH